MAPLIKVLMSESVRWKPVRERPRTTMRPTIFKSVAAVNNVVKERTGDDGIQNEFHIVPRDY